MTQTAEHPSHRTLEGELKVSACANTVPRNARTLISQKISIIATISVERATGGAFRKFLIVKAGPCLRTV